MDIKLEKRGKKRIYIYNKQRNELVTLLQTKLILNTYLL